MSEEERVRAVAPPVRPTAGPGARPAHQRTPGPRPDTETARAALGPHDVRHLQTVVGNAVVQRVVGGEDRSPVLDVIGGGGTALAPDVRADMEARLGADFSDVRVHTGGAASSSAASVGAHAYTVGSDVVFGAGRFDTTSTAGRTMLAHELTHVVQQRSGPVSGTAVGGGIAVSDPGDRFEREAAATAERVMRTPVSDVPSGGPGGTSRAQATAVQRYTDEDVNKKAYEIWEKRGRPEGEDEGRRKADHLEAKRQLRAYEVWEEKGRPPGQNPEAARGDYDKAAGEIVEAHRLLEVVKAGGKDLEAELRKQAYAVWEARGRNPGQDKAAQEADYHAGRSAMLDLLQKGLSNEEFAYVAACLMLSLPASVVESGETRKKALAILEVELYDKKIARRMLDKQTWVVVVPRDARMTDVDQFASLAGKKTFDGRPWEDVRGSGGFEVPGRAGIFVAIAEENVTGKDATGVAASGNQWCYDAGYSTTSHEMAHAVDIYGLEDADRKAIDDLYKAKRADEAKGTAVEWVDGFNKYAAVSTTQRNTLYTAADTGLAGKLTTAGLDPSYHLGARTALYQSVVNQQAMDPAYGPWLSRAGVLTHDESAVLDSGGKRALELDDKLSTAPRSGVLCYAATDRLEYFAQGANAWFGTNTGQDPYTDATWKAAGDPDRAKRRNGRSEVERIEPGLAKILARIFGAREIKGANARP